MVTFQPWLLKAKTTARAEPPAPKTRAFNSPCLRRLSG